MNARRALAVAVVVLLAGGGLGAVRALRQFETVSVDDAVARYRASASTTSTTLGTGHALASATIAASTPAAAAADVPASEPVPADVDVAAGPFEQTPPAGVYVYRTSGFEEIGIPGGHRRYPAETTMTVSPSSCGTDVRWDVFEERWDLWNTCTVGGAVDLQAFTTYHEFFRQVEQRRYTCAPGTSLRPASSTPTVGRCVDGTASVEITATIVGSEAVEVGGVTVAAVRVRLDEVLTGHTAGTRTSDSWYRVDDGLLLRRTAVTDVESETVFGHTSYDEELEVQLAALEPLR